jgi:hypothetical protein
LSSTPHDSKSSNQACRFRTAGIRFNRGTALVSIDGIAGGTVDLYDPQIVWQAQTVFGGLNPGRHSAEIRVLGRHTSGSSGNFIDIDALAGRP